MLFSIIVVTYNSGMRLKETVDSCLKQRNADFEIIIKDGGSTDFSTEFLKDLCDSRIRYFSDSDRGIYDAMNRGIDYAEGDYSIFMNSGDSFHSDNVLAEIEGALNAQKKKPEILYGDCFVVSRNGSVRLPSEWSNYACYRYTICHQAMFYRSDYLKSRKFDMQYRVCACIIHYLNAYLVDRVKLVHVPILVCNYEGGGLSDSSNGRRESLDAQYSFLKKCFGVKHYLYLAKMFVSGQLLKQLISTTPFFHSAYEKAAMIVYKVRK